MEGERERVRLEPGPSSHEAYDVANGDGTFNNMRKLGGPKFSKSIPPGGDEGAASRSAKGSEGGMEVREKENGTPELRNSGTPELRKSGNPELRNSGGTPAARAQRICGAARAVARRLPWRKFPLPPPCCIGVPPALDAGASC